MGPAPFPELTHLLPPAPSEPRFSPDTGVWPVLAASQPGESQQGVACPARAQEPRLATGEEGSSTGPITPWGANAVLGTHLMDPAHWASTDEHACCRLITFIYRAQEKGGVSVSGKFALIRQEAEAARGYALFMRGTADIISLVVLLLAAGRRRGERGGCRLGIAGGEGGRLGDGDPGAKGEGGERGGRREGSAGGRGQSGWEAGESRRKGVGEACLPLSGATGKLSDLTLETSIPGRLLQKEAGLRPRHLPLPSRCPESPVAPGRVACTAA